VKVREGAVRVKAVYLAIGVTMAGEKEVLGLWLAQTEDAKFWLRVVTQLRNRGVQDIFIACVDGLKVFPEAIEAVFPHTTLQLSSSDHLDDAVLFGAPLSFQSRASAGLRNPLPTKARRCPF
jgi:hypothetical protein